MQCDKVVSKTQPFLKGSVAACDLCCLLGSVGLRV